MIKNVDVLLPHYSMYEVLHHFTRKIYEALARTGLSCRLLAGSDQFMIPLETPPDFSIAFNGGLLLDEKRLFCEAIRVPHVSCLVDPPFQYLPILMSPYCITTCDDAYCAELACEGNAKAFFMPHAVERELSTDPTTEKIYDVTMLTTFIDCEKRREAWREKYPIKVWKAMEDAAAITLSDDTTSFIWALQNTLHDYLLTPEGEALSIEQLNTIFSELEIYIKGRDKLDLLAALKDIPIHVFGNSIDSQIWKTHFINQPNIIVHPGVSYIEAIEVMKRSKILLNNSLKNKSGAHERIFSGAACGAVVVTNDNVYMRNNFSDGKDIILFSRTKMDEIYSKIEELLANEKKREEIAELGRTNVMAHHTWDNRVADLMPKIIPIIEQMKAMK